MQAVGHGQWTGRWARAPLCGQELRGLGVHLVGRALERDDAEEHEAGDDGDLERDPERAPNVRGHARVEHLPLRRVRVVRLAEVLVVRDVPCTTM